MIMGIGGHWVFCIYNDGTVAIENSHRGIPPVKGSISLEAYVNASFYLANRINRDSLMLSYAKKKGRSINSKKHRKPRMTWIAFDSKYRPVVVTLGRCASMRYLDGKSYSKRFKASK